MAHALAASFGMFWEIFWPLALGFILSAIVQSLVSRQAVARTLGTDSPRSLAIACGPRRVLVLLLRGGGHRPVALRQGSQLHQHHRLRVRLHQSGLRAGPDPADPAGMAVPGGGVRGRTVDVVLLAFILRQTLRPRLVDEARRQAERGLRGRMEGHAAMDMAVTEGPFLKRLFSARGFTAVSQSFWMDVTSLWTDIGLGLLIAGALAAWVPDSFWQTFFLTRNPTLAGVWGPLVGPVISMFSFVCSVGNVPLAAVLWKGGISFGGVISFIFADLIIIPILNIYRKYYGSRMSLYLLAVSYATMAAAGFVIGLIFQVLGLTPTNRNITVFQ